MFQNLISASAVAVGRSTAGEWPGAGDDRALGAEALGHRCQLLGAPHVLGIAGEDEERHRPGLEVGQAILVGEQLPGRDRQRDRVCLHETRVQERLDSGLRIGFAELALELSLGPPDRRPCRALAGRR